MRASGTSLSSNPADLDMDQNAISGLVDTIGCSVHTSSDHAEGAQVRGHFGSHLCGGGHDGKVLRQTFASGETAVFVVAKQDSAGNVDA